MKFSFALVNQLRDAWSYRHEPEYLRVLADAYWRALLLILVLLLVSAALFGSLKLFEVLYSSEDLAIPRTTGGGAVLNRSDLDATLKSFDVRKERYELWKTKVPQIADPSH